MKSGAVRAGRAREKASFRVPRGLVRWCGAGNRRGWYGGAESQGCRVGGWFELGRKVFCATATPWRSTCRRYSNRSAEIVVESAAGSTKSDRSLQPLEL